jgi:hypothetical protein
VYKLLWWLALECGLAESVIGSMIVLLLAIDTIRNVISICSDLKRMTGLDIEVNACFSDKRVNWIWKE